MVCLDETKIESDTAKCNISFSNKENEEFVSSDKKIKKHSESKENK